MNKEGYKTPTEDAAIGREAMREKLRRKYGIKEGDVVTITIRDIEGNHPTKKNARVKIKEIYKHFVVLQMPAGYLTSMLWMDFEQSRSKKE